MNSGNYPDHHVSPVLAQIEEDPAEIQEMLSSTESYRSNTTSSDSSPSHVPALEPVAAVAAQPQGDAQPQADAQTQAAAEADGALVRAATTEQMRLDFFHKLYHDLPIVSSPLDLTRKIYNSVRRSNCISYRMFKTAERTAGCVVNSTNPIVSIIRGPLLKIDYMLCSTLDFVEEKVPAIKLTPSEILVNTKSLIYYVCTGRCALDCVCVTGGYSLQTANRLLHVMRCRPLEASFESGVRSIVDNLSDPTSPYYQPIVPLLPDYRQNS